MLYKLSSLFNLQPTLLVLLVGAVLYLTGLIDGNAAVKYIFQGALIISVIYAVTATVKKLLGLDKKVKKSKGVQIVGNSDGQIKETPASEEYAAPVKQPEKPVYFRVKQNPQYVMAEYSDRYELFKITAGELKKIRTDYK